MSTAMELHGDDLCLLGFLRNNRLFWLELVSAGLAPSLALLLTVDFAALLLFTSLNHGLGPQQW